MNYYTAKNKYKDKIPQEILDGRTEVLNKLQNEYKISLNKMSEIISDTKTKAKNILTHKIYVNEETYRTTELYHKKIHQFSRILMDIWAFERYYTPYPSINELVKNKYLLFRYLFDYIVKLQEILISYNQKIDYINKVYDMINRKEKIIEDFTYTK